MVTMGIASIKVLHYSLLKKEDFFPKYPASARVQGQLIKLKKKKIILFFLFFSFFHKYNIQAGEKQKCNEEQKQTETTHTPTRIHS